MSYMSHITRMNGSCRTCESVTHMDESRRTCEELRIIEIQTTQYNICIYISVDGTALRVCILAALVPAAVILLPALFLQRECVWERARERRKRKREREKRGRERTRQVASGAMSLRAIFLKSLTTTCVLYK